MSWRHLGQSMGSLEPKPPPEMNVILPVQLGAAIPRALDTDLFDAWQRQLQL